MMTLKEVIETNITRFERLASKADTNEGRRENAELELQICRDDLAILEEIEAKYTAKSAGLIILL